MNTIIKKVVAIVILALGFSSYAEESTNPQDWEPIYVEGQPRDAIIVYDVDVGDYVQNGLLYQFDGIRNVSATAPHDSTAINWNNIATNENEVSKSITFAGIDDVASGWSNGNAYYFDGNSYGTLPSFSKTSSDAATSGYTIEMAVDVKRTNQKSASYCILGMYNRATDGAITASSVNASMNLTWYTQWVVTPSPTPVISGWDGKYVTARAEAKNSYSLFQGVVITNSGNIGSSDAKLYAGNLAASNNNDTQTKGLYYSVRYYGRALSEEELARNRKIDEIRFHGNGGGTNVFIRTNLEGVELKERANEYSGYDVSGSYEFKAPSFVNLSNVGYALTGYAIEVRNPETGVWGTPTTNIFAKTDKKSFVYTNCLARASVRLTWLWDKIGRLISSDCDVDDYVQEGLVAHYDGIRNVAKDQEHDANSTVWKNLVGTNDVAFFDTDSALSCWTNGAAYYFDGTSYAKVTNNFDLSKREATIEMALDIDVSKQNTSYCLLGEYYNATQGAISGNQKGGSLTWYDIYRYNPSVKPTINGWEGKYVVAMASATQVSLFQGTDIDNSSSHNYSGTLGQLGWTFASAQNITAKTKGMYYALRFYNRMLSEEELTYNRIIDDIRFRGKALANIVVEVKPADVSDVTTGAYVVQGKWVFLAPEATINGKKRLPKGYSLEVFNNDGTRVSKTHFSELSYEYTPEEGESAVLTWEYMMPGLRIIVR